ncbi:hypothetical protein ACLOJK_038313 [Asimina triloba]
MAEKDPIYKHPIRDPKKPYGPRRAAGFDFFFTRDRMLHVNCRTSFFLDWLTNAGPDDTTGFMEASSKVPLIKMFARTVKLMPNGTMVPELPRHHDHFHLAWLLDRMPLITLVWTAWIVWPGLMQGWMGFHQHWRRCCYGIFVGIGDESGQ